jgi:hypothetical protein
MTFFGNNSRSLYDIVFIYFSYLHLSRKFRIDLNSAYEVESNLNLVLYDSK